MKIAIFGATGRVGQKVAKHIHEEGNEVKALVRDKNKAEEFIPFAEIVIGSSIYETDVLEALHGCDGVISALSTDKNTVLSESMPLIVNSMQKLGIERIVSIGTAGILDSRYEEGKYRFQSSESKRKTTFAAEEHFKAYQTLAESSLKWTVVCPTYLPEGKELGGIRWEKNLLPVDGRKISTGDTARFAWDCFKEDHFIGTRVGICY
ncbi:NAD(P)-dependent oxidoreductase [Pontibacillus sp. HMF3514]|uniref:NAD(P)-dependent oxidoreductase n=1 Tax=Pontibacillus sp. HMF3514 TaxID=2692425 RepID=UPI00131F57C8|nr:NAD(P)H-binding protein [Pontibacillus sp. HMF3514]QHE51313.1 NAD(P)H-binding protein [Pontibacillus sp. HMF3514]